MSLNVIHIKIYYAYLFGMFLSEITSILIDLILIYHYTLNKIGSFQRTYVV